MFLVWNDEQNSWYDSDSNMYGKKHPWLRQTGQGSMVNWLNIGISPPSHQPDCVIDLICLFPAFFPLAGNADGRI